MRSVARVGAVDHIWDPIVLPSKGRQIRCGMRSVARLGVADRMRDAVGCAVGGGGPHAGCNRL